jgi:multisubunit Na+/H+ antiporter MnhB subunit
MDARVVINLFHILFVAPFLLWVGISRGNTPDGAFTTLLVLGIIVTLYHAYKSWIRLAAKSSYVWVNLIHALWIGPLLLYIGARKKDTERPVFEMLLLTAFGALGYHLYELAAHYDFL